MPRSLHFQSYNEPISSPRFQLLVGQGDGRLLSFQFKHLEEKLEGPRMMALGDKPIQITPCVVGGSEMMIANGDRSIILFWKDEALKHTPILLKVGSRHSISVSLCLTYLEHYSNIFAEYTIIWAIVSSGIRRENSHWSCAGCRQVAHTNCGYHLPL